MVRVLLLGGHGKVALRMTKLLAAQNHTVTSIIRDPNHIAEIQSLHPDLVKPVVASIEEADDQAAKNLVSEHEWVVWSAGISLLPQHHPGLPKLP
jgi:nucleoside-diphosphate-sugar epimerase